MPGDTFCLTASHWKTMVRHSAISGHNSLYSKNKSLQSLSPVHLEVSRCSKRCILHSSLVPEDRRDGQSQSLFRVSYEHNSVYQTHNEKQRLRCAEIRPLCGGDAGWRRNLRPNVAVGTTPQRWCWPRREMIPTKVRR